jgi:non-specific serine/threonine protein kinase
MVGRNPVQRGVGALPAETTSFVGRRRELARIAELLTRARLITLTGPGGVGKTRTAIRLARDRHEDFPDGVMFVPLSPLSDPALLPNAVAAALDLPEQSARPAIETVAEYLAEHRTLLVLDTCEHLVDGCAQLAEALLAAAPQLRILATSRQPLDVPGEHLLPVPALALPDADSPAPPAGAAAEDALALFADRAAAAVPGFVLDEDNRADALTLCRRLDGIPLAIELAVSRLRVLSLEEMNARLDRRFTVLNGHRRTPAVPRHQTLRTTFEWSYDLCTPPERLLWQRLSVFAGSFTLAAAEAVCADAQTDAAEAEAELPRGAVLDALICLVEKSVVLRVDSGEQTTRYQMLDTIREFGAELLEASGARPALQTGHRDHFLGRARSFDAEWTGDHQVVRVRELAQDQADLRAALEFSLSAPGQAPYGLETAIRLWGFWHVTGLLTEGRYWLRRALAQHTEPTPDRVFALCMTSWYMDLQGEQGDNWPLLEEARTIAERIGDERGGAWALAFHAHTRYFRGRFAGCAEDFAEAAERMAAADDTDGLIMHGFYAGFMHILAGSPGEGIALCDDSLRRNTAPSERWSRSWALWVKCVGLWLKDDHEQSIECAREGIRAKADLHDVMGIAHFLETFAWQAAELRHFERVAVLQGAADALWRRAAKEARFGIPVLHGLHREARTAARRVLGPDTYHRSFEEGGRLALDTAVEIALMDDGGSASPEVPAQTSGPADGLTPREQQVAALVAQGMTNRDVAERLVISKRTADAHVQHILSKLGLSSREQITGFPAPPG